MMPSIKKAGPNSNTTRNSKSVEPFLRQNRRSRHKYLQSMEKAILWNITSRGLVNVYRSSIGNCYMNTRVPGTTLIM
jgi:hypothetical protein